MTFQLCLGKIRQTSGNPLECQLRLDMHSDFHKEFEKQHLNRTTFDTGLDDTYFVENIIFDLLQNVCGNINYVKNQTCKIPFPFGV